MDYIFWKFTFIFQKYIIKIPKKYICDGSITNDKIILSIICNWNFLEQKFNRKDATRKRRLNKYFWILNK